MDLPKRSMRKIGFAIPAKLEKTPTTWPVLFALFKEGLTNGLRKEETLVGCTSYVLTGFLV
jgi:hypothetical protein